MGCGPVPWVAQGGPSVSSRGQEAVQVPAPCDPLRPSDDVGCFATPPMVPLVVFHYMGTGVVDGKTLVGVVCTGVEYRLFEWDPTLTALCGFGNDGSVFPSGVGGR